MRQPAIHFNPPDSFGLTQCGFKAGDHKWSTNRDHVTCQNCLRRLAAIDKRKEERG